MNDLYGEIKFYDYKYPNPIKQIRLIDYFAGLVMLGLSNFFYDMKIQSDMQEAVEKSYVIAKMMIEESKKYEDNT